MLHRHGRGRPRQRLYLHAEKYDSFGRHIPATDFVQMFDATGLYTRRLMRLIFS